MATTDAKPVPIKAAAYRVTFPIFDADGDLVTGATGLDSEVSKDAGTFADCTNEATEIATSSGVYYLDLTSTEMTADTVAIIVKTSSSGAKTTPIFLYPQEAGDIPVTVEAMNAGTVTATAIATGAIDADAIAADAITDAKVASDVTIASVTGAVGSVTAAVNVGTIEGTDATDALTSAAEAALASTDTTVGTIAADVTTLLGRLSAARAGYLDNLSAGAVALASAVTSSALAQAIWNAVAATYNTASSMGALLNSAGAASDPLLNTVPGSYASGSAGHALGRVGSGQITTVSTVAQSGDITEIIGGADYNNTDGYALDWTDTSAAWPTLTSATITVQMLAPNGETYAPAGSVVTATGASKKVRLELTAAQTAAIQAKYVGVWSFVVWATLSSTRIVPLVVGQVPVKNPPGP